MPELFEQLMVPEGQLTTYIEESTVLPDSYPYSLVFELLVSDPSENFMLVSNLHGTFGIYYDGSYLTAFISNYSYEKGGLIDFSATVPTKVQINVTDQAGLTIYINDTELDGVTGISQHFDNTTTIFNGYSSGGGYYGSTVLTMTNIVPEIVTDIKLGTLPVDTFKLGATQVDKVMLGADEVWTNAAPPGTEVFTSSGTFIPKAGHIDYLVEVMGGGGGGSGAGTNSGGGGGYQALLVSDTLTLTDDMPVTVGSGGGGGGEYNGGSVGGTSTVDTLSSVGGPGGLTGTVVIYSAGTSSDWGAGGSEGSYPGGTGGTGGIGAGGGGGGKPTYNGSGDGGAGGAGGRGEVRITWPVPEA